MQSPAYPASWVGLKEKDWPSREVMQLEDGSVELLQIQVRSQSEAKDRFHTPPQTLHVK
jgi:hypothetical protein